MEIKRRFGEVRQIAEDAKETRTVSFVISNATKDRHGTVLNPKKWDLKNYRKNPVVAYAHNIYGGLFSEPNPDMLLGSSKVKVEGDELIGEVTFETEDVNPLAEKIFKKILSGTIRGASVGFLPIGEGKYGKEEEAEDGSDPTFYYAGQELLEWSIVPIPSNPDTAKRASKDEKEELFMYVVKSVVGDKLTDEDIKKLTVKGVLDTISGVDTKRIQEEDEEKKIKEETIIKNKLKGIQLNVYTRLKELTK